MLDVRIFFFFSGKALLGSLLQQVGASSSRSLAHSLAELGQAGSFYGLRIGVCPGLGLEGWLR